MPMRLPNLIRRPNTSSRQLSSTEGWSVGSQSPHQLEKHRTGMQHMLSPVLLVLPLGTLPEYIWPGTQGVEVVTVKIIPTDLPKTICLLYSKILSGRFWYLE